MSNSNLIRVLYTAQRKYVMALIAHHARYLLQIAFVGIDGQYHQETRALYNKLTKHGYFVFLYVV